MNFEQNFSSESQNVNSEQLHFEQHLSDKIIDISVLWFKYIDQNQFPLDANLALILLLENIIEISEKFAYSSVNQLASNIKNQLHQFACENRAPNAEEVTYIGNLIKILHKPLNNRKSDDLTKQKSNTFLIYLYDENIAFNERTSMDVKRAGFDIVCFSNRKLFEKSCLESPPPCIICNVEFIQQENSNNNAFFAKLKENSTQVLNIIYISDISSFSCQLTALRNSGDFYLTKPLLNANLFNLLHSLETPIQKKRFSVLFIGKNNDIAAIADLLDTNRFEINIIFDLHHIFTELDKTNPELIILEDQYGECTAIELLKIIRQERNYQVIPSIILSSENTRHIDDMNIDASLNFYLNRKTTASMFNKILQDLCNSSKQIKNLIYERNTNRRKASNLQSAMDQHSIVSATDAKGNIIFANDKFCSISGFSSSELLGKNHKIVNSGYHKADFFQQMWQHISKGETWQGEICNRNKNGNIYWVKASIIPYLNRQRTPYQYISIRTDITKVKAAELLAQKKEVMVSQHNAAIIQLAKDNTLLSLGLESSLQKVFTLCAEQMHAQRISLWEINQDNDLLKCISSYTTSSQEHFNSDELIISRHKTYLDLIKKENVLVASDVQSNDIFKEFQANYLLPCNIQSKMDIALYINAKFCGILFIETVNTPYHWTSEHYNFAKSIAESLSQRILQSKTIQTRHELEKSESRLRISQKQANVGTWDWEIETGKLFWSEQVAVLFGYETSIPETTYNTFYSAIHPDDRELVILSIKACIEESADYNLEHRIVTQKGETRWISTQGSVIHDAAGKPSNMLCLVHDIHDRKILEYSVNRQQTLLNTIRVAITEFVESLRTKNIAELLLPDLLALTDSKLGFIGSISIIDEKPTLITQATSENQIIEIDTNSNDSHELIFSDIGDLLNLTIEQNETVISNNLPTDSRIKLVDSDCSNIPESYLGIPIIYGGKTVGMFGLANRDQGYNNEVIDFLQPFTLTYGVIIHAQNMAIKEQEQRQEIIQARELADRANQAKSVFLSNMSHELRTPLNAILGFAQLLAFDVDNTLNDTQRDSINEIHTAGDHLLLLINDVLDLSKIETGIISLDIENFSLADLIQECLGLVSTAVTQKQIQLNIQINDIHLTTDRHRLKLVLLNLITNAVKYNKDNGQIKISSQTIDEYNIRIEVKDTGIGIASEDHGKMFQSFQRLGAENTNIQGTGIGLVIAKNMVENLSGTLTFTSKKDIGTQFWIDIPNCIISDK